MTKPHKLSADFAEFDTLLWPIELQYHPKNSTSQNALLLLRERVAATEKLIFAVGDFYTLGNGGIWHKLEADDLRAEIRLTDPGANHLTSGEIRAMLDELKITNTVRTKARPFEWLDKPDKAPDAKNLVLAANGIVNSVTGNLMTINDGRYFATALPEWEYDPAATCPLWEAKLKEWLHPDFVKPLQDFLGYSLNS